MKMKTICGYDQVMSPGKKLNQTGIKLKVHNPGGYLGFQVMGMIEWSQKLRPKKIPRLPAKPQKITGPKINPPKIPMPILLPLKVHKRKSQAK